MKHTILLLLIFIVPNIVRAQSPADSCVITSLPYVQDFKEYTIVSQGADSVFVPCWHRMGSTANPTSCIYISTPGVAVEENTKASRLRTHHMPALCCHGWTARCVPGVRCSCGCALSPLLVF